MYIVLTKLVLTAIHDPIDASLSQWQAGARKGRTTTGQAIGLWANLAHSGAPRYVCYLDIAKAFPSAPHRSLLRALQTLGTRCTYFKWLNTYMKAAGISATRLMAPSSTNFAGA